MHSPTALTPTTRFRLATVFLVAIILVVNSRDVQATDPLRTQTLGLTKGWNAVYLEVEPADAAPEVVFKDLPVDIVAQYFPRQSSVQFITNPDEEDFNKPSWGVWYAPGRPDAFLKGLHAISGNEPYLIHATADTTWEIEGKVALPRHRWRSGSFNLKGFSVDENSPPTFAEYFAGSGGKIGERIYRLSGGNWIKVANPATTRMRAGEACWISATGTTNFQGPVEVKTYGR